MKGNATKPRMLVFRSNRRGQGYDAWGIQIIDGKPQGRPQCLIKNLDQADTVSRAGQLTRDGSLYYAVAEPRRSNACIAALDLETGKVTDPRRASERPEGDTGCGEWSPDGKHLLYKFTPRRPTQGERPMIVIRSVDTGQKREIPLPPGIRVVWYAMPWSPDGRSIMVMREVGSGSRWELCRLDVPSGRITSEVAGTIIPAYPPIPFPPRLTTPSFLFRNR